MWNRTYRTGAIAAAVAAVFALVAGCSVQDEMTAADVPNEPPDTRLEGQSPVSVADGFTVHFAWNGSDADGKISGFEWKLVRHAAGSQLAGFSGANDPSADAGAEGWQFTRAGDRTFTLSLTDTEGNRTSLFTLYVRAVDDRGGVDPSPAYIRFNSSTLLPQVVVDRPPAGPYPDAQPVPPTVTFGYTGVDPDFYPDRPIKARFIWKRALYLDDYITTQYEFVQIVHELLRFDDPAWSDWLPYYADPEQRTVTFYNQPIHDDQGRRISYLFAVQVMDTTGTVSLDLEYGRNVRNVYISQDLAPVLTVYEVNYLGLRQAAGPAATVNEEVLGGQGLEFMWLGDAESYGGTVEAYRYGWNLVDPDDPDDPGWALPPGNTPDHRRIAPMSLSGGMQTLTIQCWDNLDQLTRLTYLFDVIPIPDPSAQKLLLLVDDVKDQQSNAWPGSDGITPLDRDQYRDAFWEDVLTGSGGVVGFNPAGDVVDTEDEMLQLRDLVNYRSVVWTTRYAVDNFIWSHFKPFVDGHAPPNWLEAYQASAGNVLMAGDRAMNEFIEERTWMIPWVFDTDEQVMEFGGQMFAVGFGTEELPDGSTLRLGTQRYPYRAMGIALLDHITPRYNVFGMVGAGSISNSARNSACAGVKGLVLDPDFKALYMPGGGVFADTILTDETIDWQDLDADNRDRLRTWIWGGDEFYDGNISIRTTPWSPQSCDTGPCLEPMFRVYSRFDWVDDLHLAAGDPDWPAPIYDWEELQTVCGRHALDPGTGRTKTTSQVTGFISHKLEADKPSGRGDVLWGFDPYRFDHAQIKQAIQWVLGEQFGLVLAPR